MTSGWERYCHTNNTHHYQHRYPSYPYWSYAPGYHANYYTYPYVQTYYAANTIPTWYSTWSAPSYDYRYGSWPHVNLYHTSGTSLGADGTAAATAAASASTLAASNRAIASTTASDPASPTQNTEFPNCPVCNPPYPCTYDTTSTPTTRSCSDFCSSTSTEESTYPSSRHRRHRRHRHSSYPSLPTPGLLNYNPHLVTILIRQTPYLILRPHLHTHLPRLRHDYPNTHLLHSRQIAPETLIHLLPYHLRKTTPGRGADLLDASLGFLARYLEGISGRSRSSSRGNPQSLLLVLGWRVVEGPRVTVVANGMLEIVVAMALILDPFRGVGCSAELAEDFMEVICWVGKAVRRVSGAEHQMMLELMVALARVYRGTKTGKRILKNLWGLLEDREMREVWDVIGKLIINRRVVREGERDSMLVFRDAIAPIVPESVYHRRPGSLGLSV